MNLGDPRCSRCAGEDGILMILMMSIKMGVSGIRTDENLSKINRKSIEHLSKIFRKSIEHLWIWGGSGVDLGWILGGSGWIWVDLVDLGWIWRGSWDRKSIEHLSKIYRTSMDLGWILGGSGALQMAEHREKQCFTFFPFLPPYIGVSGSLTYLKR